LIIESRCEELLVYYFNNILLEERIVYFGESITGRRSNNEDSFLCEKIDDKTFLFIVADGMGGSEHGEVASKLAVSAFSSHVKESFQQPVPKSRLKLLLEESFRKTQVAVKEEVEKEVNHIGMGTTFVVLLIHDNAYVWGNIGDSRLYKIENKSIEQITRDHTYVEEVLKKLKGGNINEDHLDQYSHIITRSVSGGNDKPDLFPESKDFLNLGTPKMFLLCSDGLISKKSNKKDESEFFMTYQENPEPETFAKRLVMNAFENGSEDNITALCVSCGKVTGSARGIINKTLTMPDNLIKWINRNSKK
jgi:serine/threonine protein phosphatase PrpC